MERVYNLVWDHPLVQPHEDPYWYERGLLTPDEVDDILATEREWTRTKGKDPAEPRPDFSVNDATVALLDPVKDEEIYDRIAWCCQRANERWRFDVWGFTEPLTLMSYRSGQQIGWHSDYDLYDPWKLTVQVQLTPPDSYEGGELEVIGREGILPTLRPGDALVTPSYLVHRITPVVSGERIVIVGWVAGPRFR